MGKPVYEWMIIYGDNSTEIVTADNVEDAVENGTKDWYDKGVKAIIRLDYAMDYKG